MRNVSKEKNKNIAQKTYDKINKRNLKIRIIILLSFFAFFVLAIFVYDNFFVSKLDSSKRKEEELYFAMLFVDDNKTPYGAFLGVVSSLNNRIGFVSIPSNTAFWIHKSSYKSVEEYYKEGGEKLVFDAIEKTIDKKLTYRITLDNKSIESVIDLLGGVRMYVEDNINYIDDKNGYNLIFNTGEHLFTSKKVIAYLHYLELSINKEREVLYKLEDVFLNILISFVQDPYLRTRITSVPLLKEFAKHIKHNLNVTDLKNISRILSSATKKSFIMQTIDGSLDRKNILVPTDKGQNFAKQINNMALYVGLKTERTKILNEHINISVLNATGITSLADRINIRMRYRGFLAGEYGNFRTNINESVILVRNGEIEKAFVVADEGKINRVYAKTDRRVLNDAVMVLGGDYYEITR